MMTCKNCGSPLQGHEKFCGVCGAAVPAEKPVVSDVPELTLTPPDTLLFDGEPVREESAPTAAETVMGQEPPEAPGSQGMPERPAPEAPRAVTTTAPPRQDEYAYRYRRPDERQNAPKQAAPGYVPEEEKDPDRVIGMWGYALSLFLMSLPIAGLVLQIVWASGATDSVNRRNLARGALFLWVVRLAITVMLVTIFMALFARFIPAALRWFSYYG